MPDTERQLSTSSDGRKLSPLNVNLNHLHDFYVIVCEGTVSKAADILCISQPALSNRIKSFEESLGEQLFHRNGRGLSLTPAGEKVFNYASRVFTTAEALIHDLRQKLDNSCISIRVGACEQMDQCFVVDVAKRIKEECMNQPDVRVSMIWDQTEKCVEYLQQGKIDLLLNSKPAGAAGVTNLKRIDTIVNLLASAELAEKLGFADMPKSITAGELFKTLLSRGASFTMPGPNLYFRGEIDNFLSRHGVNPPIVFEANAMSSFIRSITLGIGIALVPVAYFNDEVRSGGLVSLGPVDGFWPHAIWVLSNSDDNRFHS